MYVRDMRSAAQIYLNYIGVDTILLSGYADGGGHAWNAVKVRQW